MLIVEIILLILFIIGTVFAIREKESGIAVWSTTLACGMIACILLDIVIPHGVRKLHTTNFEVSTNIKTEILNGKETSRDTVYIFTPKRK